MLGDPALEGRAANGERQRLQVDMMRTLDGKGIGRTVKIFQTSTIMRGDGALQNKVPERPQIRGIAVQPLRRATELDTVVQHDLALSGLPLALQEQAGASKQALGQGRIGHIVGLQQQPHGLGHLPGHRRATTNPDEFLCLCGLYQCGTHHFLCALLEVQDAQTPPSQVDLVADLQLPYHGGWQVCNRLVIHHQRVDLFGVGEIAPDLPCQ